MAVPFASGGAEEPSSGCSSSTQSAQSCWRERKHSPHLRFASSNSSLLLAGSLPLGSIAMASSGDAPGSTGERLLASIGRIYPDLRLAGTIKSRPSYFFPQSWCGSFILSRICFVCAESVDPIRSPVARFGARASSISLLGDLGLLVTLN